MNTTADLVTWIETEKPFTPSFQKKVLGSVRRMKRMAYYGVPLDQIHIDLQMFDATWGRGPVRSLPVGFNSKKSFSDWRSQVRSALAAQEDVSKPVVAQAVDDDWAVLRSNLGEAGVSEEALISVKVLADKARKASLSPLEVSRTWLQKTVDTSHTTGRYRAIQAAIKIIHRHKDCVRCDLSPDFDGQPVHKSRSHCIRTKFTDTLDREISEWLQNRIAGEPKGVLRKRKNETSPKRAKQILLGVSYVYTSMLQSGLIDKNQDLSVTDLAGKEFLEDVIERELDDANPWQRLENTTLFEYVNNWKLFVKGCGIDVTPLTAIIGSFHEFENIKGMSSGRRDWCEAFLNNHDKQVAFLSLPNTLFKSAQKAMMRYEEGSQYQRKRAVSLSVAACAAAIWTSLPLRISTVLQLTYGNGNADVQIHNTKGNLILTTPPDIVKNGYSHRYINLIPKRGGNPHEIVSWFTDQVRPLLLQNHIQDHLRQPEQLFGGLSYARLNSIWQQVALEAGLDMTPHQVRHALATLMANLPNADYSIIAALLGDTEATVRKNYVFVDQARMHKEGQKVLAQLQGHVLMRGTA